MRIEDVEELAMSLPGVRRSGRPGRLKWLVDGRLVVREDEPGSVIVRVGFAERERLLEQHPETFGVPPRCEKHMKMQADLDGDAHAISDAIRRAWAMQSGDEATRTAVIDSSRGVPRPRATRTDDERSSRDDS